MAKSKAKKTKDKKLPQAKGRGQRKDTYLKAADDTLYFIPLGGSEQFGVNLNVYLHKGQMLLIDCGIGFADDFYPGIDLLLPDPAFVESNIKHLQGIIITHAHEDHIGAVPYLWQRIKAPIYCSAFTGEVLRKKFEENGHKDYEIITIEPGKTEKIGAFSIEPITVSHSVPDAVAIYIEAGDQRVLHSGDWNLDPSPVLGEKTDKKAFEILSKKGVHAYVGDSTNAIVDGSSGSEAQVAKGLQVEFEQCRGRIVVTIFSSNIGRILSIARAAKACGREVAVIGRSLHRMIGAAKHCGYLDELDNFVGEEEIAFVPRDRLVVIATGSQGEYRAALAKIARGDHRLLKLDAKDTVIFSSRAIPGNEKRVSDVKNNLSGAGVNIICAGDTPNVIHVSGHPCREEISEMLSWVKPKCVIPVHGERVQLEAQSELATQCQIAQTLVPSNGSVIRITPNGSEIIDHVATGVLAVDQRRIIPADHQSIVARRKLQYSGALHVSIALDDEGELLGKPKLDEIGLNGEDEYGTEFKAQLIEELYSILEDMHWEDREDDHAVQEELRIGLRRFVYHELGFKPSTTIHVLRV